MSPWILVILSGLLEAGWAIGLKTTDGFTKLVPTVLTLAGMIASFILLSLAARQLPIGTAYAVWVGIGVIGASILGVAIFGEAISLARGASLALVVLGIVGLKLTS